MPSTKGAKRQLMDCSPSMAVDILPSDGISADNYGRNSENAVTLDGKFEQVADLATEVTKTCGVLHQLDALMADLEELQDNNKDLFDSCRENEERSPTTENGHDHRERPPRTVTDHPGPRWTSQGGDISKVEKKFLTRQRSKSTPLPHADV